MRLLRIALYLGIIVITIFSWESCRDNLKVLFETLTCESLASEKPTEPEEESQPQESLATQETPENVENKESSKKQDETEPSLLSFEKGFEDVAKGAMHSVVNVATMQLVDANDGLESFFGESPFDDILKDFFDFPQKKQKKTKKVHALGSGFIVKVNNGKAYVVTNNHVIEKAKKILVYLADKTELPTEIHAVDQRTDLAVLSIDLKSVGIDPKLFKPIEWGDSDNVHEGNWVIAIGNPFGFGSTITNGIVSAKGRSIAASKTSLSLVDDFIQHSAPINMGNSGGCLLDIHGKVIGINTAIFSTNGGNMGIGFAIPSNIAKNTVEQLIEHKRTFRGWLGAEVQAVGAKQAESVGLIKKTLDCSKLYGAFVARLVPGGPAEKAGIKVGDIILEFDGKKISEKSSLTSIVSTSTIGKDAEIIVWRNGEKGWKKEKLMVKIGDFEKALENGSLDNEEANTTDEERIKKEETIDALGITISQNPAPYDGRQSKAAKVIVTKVDDSKENSFFGPIFEPGDEIISANNQKVTSVSQFKKIIDDIKNDKSFVGRQIPFVISRGKSVMFLATTIDFANEKNNEKSSTKDR